MVEMKNSANHLKAIKPLRSAIFAFGIVAAMLTWTHPSNAQSRIKDIVDIEGVRENILIGYGLVVGLNGTGDTLASNVFTKQSLIGMLAWKACLESLMGKLACLDSLPAWNAYL